MTNIIFPASLNDYKLPDPFWEKETNAAEKAGFKIGLLTGSHFNAGGLSIYSRNQYTSSLYRGWILKPTTYEELSSIHENNLINSYNDYLWSYNFPEWYQDFPKGETPSSFYFPADQIIKLGLEKIAAMIEEQAGSKSLLMKDWLKSRKAEWYDACFIRDASDNKECIRIMENFLNYKEKIFMAD